MTRMPPLAGTNIEMSSSPKPVWALDGGTGSSQAWFTVERALYLFAFIAGIILRFGALAQKPLNSLEAWNAWAAWQTATDLPGPAELTPVSPLWHSLQTWLFWTGVDGDGWARSVAAAAGALLILAPWGLRGLMGRPAALALSALIALDPWLVTLSRLADGAMLSAALAMALLAGAARLLTNRRSVIVERMMAVSAGLFLVSGPTAWSFLPLLATFALMNRRALFRSAAGWREALLLFTVSAVAGATAGLTQLDGVGLVSRSLTVWLESVFAIGAPAATMPASGGYPLGWPITRLLIDQPLLTLFGLGGLIYLPLSRRLSSATRDARWPLFLWLWFGWGVLLCLSPGRSPFSLIVLVLPLLVGAAHALSELIALWPRYGRSQETSAMFLTLTVLAVSGSFWGIAMSSSASFDAVLAQAVAVIAAVGLALLVLYGAWTDPRQAAWIGAASIAALALLGTISSTWQINYRHAPDRRDSLFVEKGGEGLRQLVQDINTISAQRAGDPYEIAIFVQHAQPTNPGNALLGWSLRHMRRLTWRAPQAEELAAAPAPLVIQAADITGIAAPAQDYIGSDYVHRVIWLPADLVPEGDILEDAAAGAAARLSVLWTRTLYPWLRWAHQRRADIAPQAERVILWVLSDGAEAYSVGTN